MDKGDKRKKQLLQVALDVFLYPYLTFLIYISAKKAVQPLQSELYRLF